jgi:FKBP-type peptidyl-prolyl cis-trans isomerase
MQQDRQSILRRNNNGQQQQSTTAMMKARHICQLLLSAQWMIFLLQPTAALSLDRPSTTSKPSTQQTDPFSSFFPDPEITRKELFFLTVMMGFFLDGTIIPSPALAEPDPPKKLTFQTLDSGVRVADIILPGNNGDAVTPTSKVNVHITGRLLGKQGWIFEDSLAAGEDPFRLDLGTGTVIVGLEEGLQGMRVGGRRRIVIPSAVGYTNRSLEPIPRDFGNRQRLYTTVMNTVRIEREQQALGADLAGMVVMDVQLIRLRN